MAKADTIYEQVTAKVIESLEAGIASGTWTPPWRDHGTGFPHNVTTGRAYTGGNVFALWFAEIDNEYPTSEWATYKQWYQDRPATDEEIADGTARRDRASGEWRTATRYVRKGETSTYLIKWVEPSGKRDRARDGEDAKKPRLVPVGFGVFNAAQVEGYVAPEQPKSEHDPIEHADAFFRATGSVVQDTRNEGRAYYSIGGDYIVLPPLADFHAVEGFYATLAHEHVHWSGAKERLDRVGITGNSEQRTREAYAYEELIAELGSAFLGAILDITPELRDDHVQYLRSWLSALKNDKKLIFKAASQAQKAVDFLAAFSEEKVEVAA